MAVHRKCVENAGKTSTCSTMLKRSGSAPIIKPSKLKKMMVVLFFLSLFFLFSFHFFFFIPFFAFSFSLVLFPFFFFSLFPFFFLFPVSNRDFFKTVQDIQLPSLKEQLSFQKYVNSVQVQSFIMLTAQIEEDPSDDHYCMFLSFCLLLNPKKTLVMTIIVCFFPLSFYCSRKKNQKREKRKGRKRKTCLYLCF